MYRLHHSTVTSPVHEELVVGENDVYDAATAGATTTAAIIGTIAVDTHEAVCWGIRWNTHQKKSVCRQFYYVMMRFRRLCMHKTVERNYETGRTGAQKADKVVCAVSNSTRRHARR